MRTTTLRLAAASAAVVLALTGCGSDGDAGGSATKTKDGDAQEVVEWMDDVCGAVFDSISPMLKQPELGSAAGPEEVKDVFLTYLTGAQAAVEDGIASLEDLSDGPHADSEKAITELNKLMGTLKNALDASVDNVESADPSDPTQFQAQFQKVVEEMGGVQAASDDFEEALGDSGLDDAAEKAENCNKLDEQS